MTQSSPEEGALRVNAKTRANMEDALRVFHIDLFDLEIVPFTLEWASSLLAPHLNCSSKLLEYIYGVFFPIPAEPLSKPVLSFS